MLRRIMVIFLVILIFLQTACTQQVVEVSGKAEYSENGVSIVNKGNYFDVQLDYSTGLTYQQVGNAYAKAILEVVPNYEKLVDSYLADLVSKYQYKNVLYRVEDVKPQINKNYIEEISGIAQMFSGGNENIRNDGKISEDEFFLYNLFADVYRGTQCSFVSVFGDYSENKKTIAARNLDWFGGNTNQLHKIQAVITIKYPDKKICLIGYMGFMGALTIFNDEKVFAAIMDSPSGSAFISTGMRSYPLDLRYAIEHTSTLEEVANYMKDAEKHYTYNHIICLSDPKESVVLENNFSGSGSDGKRVSRAVRHYDSKLNNDITWAFDNAIGAVNSFVLYGNNNNHSSSDYNVDRWKTMKEQLGLKGTTVSVDELKEVITFKKGSLKALSETKYLYNKLTAQSVIFQPETFDLQVYFRPKNSSDNQANPVYEKIEVFK